MAQVNPPTPEFDRAPTDTEVTFVPLEAVWSSGLDVSRRRPKAEVAQGYTRFREGDVLVPKITPTFEAARSTIASGLVGGFGAGTTELHVIRCGPGLDNRYLNYLVSSRHFLKGGEAVMVGVAGQKRVPDSWIRNFPVPVASLPVQRAIADFLDAKTSRIDALIAKKRRMIGLLSERRAGAVETEIGRLASLYGLQPLKKVATISVSNVDKKSVDGEMPVRLVNYTDVYYGARITPDLPLMSATATVQQLASFRLSAGDVVITKDSETPEDIGAAAFVQETAPDLVLGYHLALLRPKQGLVAPRYVYWCMCSDLARGQLSAAATGVTRFGLRKDVIASVLLPAPDVTTQRAIADLLDTAISRIDALIAKLMRQSSLLHEHRQALITAAVTGEIEVPGVAA